MPSGGELERNIVGFCLNVLASWCWQDVLDACSEVSRGQCLACEGKDLGTHYLVSLFGAAALYEEACELGHGVRPAGESDQHHERCRCVVVCWPAERLGLCLDLLAVARPAGIVVDWAVAVVKGLPQHQPKEDRVLTVEVVQPPHIVSKVASGQTDSFSMLSLRFGDDGLEQGFLAADVSVKGHGAATARR